MSDCNFTVQIDPNRFLGETLDDINNNFNNLSNGAESIYQSLTGVQKGNVTYIGGGFNTNAVTTTNRSVTISQPTCPQWHLGQTGLPLYQEIGDNRISQIFTRKTEYLKYLKDVAEFNPPMQNAITIIPSKANNTVAGDVEGAITLADGRVYFSRSNYGSGTSAIYDPSTDTFTAAAGATGLRSCGGVLMADGRVFLTPSDQSSAGAMYDPQTDKVTYCGGTWKTNNKYAFYNSALLPNGNVFCNPTSEKDYAIIYDPVTNTTIYSDNLANGRSASCVTMLDGNVYRVPGGWKSFPGTVGTTAYIYNYKTNKFSPVGGTFSKSESGWLPARLLIDGRVFMAPNDPGCKGARIYDPITDTLKATTSVGFFNSSFDTYSLYYGGCTLLPDGRLFLINWNGSGNTCTVYDPASDLALNVPNITGLRWAGVHLLSNGNIICAGYPNFVQIARFYYQKNFSLNVLTSPFFNKTY